jgi:hypothetical protein
MSKNTTSLAPKGRVTATQKTTKMIVNQTSHLLPASNATPLKATTYSIIGAVNHMYTVIDNAIYIARCVVMKNG